SKLTAARFNKNATLLAVADGSGRVGLHDATGRLLITLSVRGPLEVQCLAWAPSDERIAVGTRDGMIQIWLRDGTLNRSFFAFPTGVDHLQYSPDDRWLIAGPKHGGINIWDSETAEVLVNNGSALRSFARDGHRFAASENTHVGFREIVEPQALQR